MTTRISLPTILPPKKGSAAVFKASEGFKGPFFTGPGSIDLHCGGCSSVLAKGMSSGQIQNLVFQCPSCNEHNVVIDIPIIEGFISKLLESDIPREEYPKFKKILAESLENPSPSDYVSEQLAEEIPDLSWIERYLIPTNAGETYAMLCFILAFLTWYQTRPKKKNEGAQTVINNYFYGSDPFKDVGRNQPCPCGSGKKFKHCHGA